MHLDTNYSEFLFLTTPGSAQWNYVMLGFKPIPLPLANHTLLSFVPSHTHHTLAISNLFSVLPSFIEISPEISDYGDGSRTFGGAERLGLLPLGVLEHLKFT